MELQGLSPTNPIVNETSQTAYHDIEAPRVHALQINQQPSYARRMGVGFLAFSSGVSTVFGTLAFSAASDSRRSGNGADVTDTVIGCVCMAYALGASAAAALLWPDGRGQNVNT